MDPHSISCTFSNLLEQKTVEWTTATVVTDLNLDPDQVTQQGTSKTSTLQLSSAQLVKLKTAGDETPEHIFTCKILADPSNTPIIATQTVNIYTPGKFKLFNMVFDQTFCAPN